MKNQYFGDINDYRKYGLLRILADEGRFKIGVCWMLTADDGRSDGQLTSYLGQPKRWRAHDPALFDSLHGWVTTMQRHVKLVRDGKVLPGACFHEELLEDHPASRERYFENAWEGLGSAELVFFDPDNGLEVKSVARGRRGSCKYLYWAELEKTFQMGQSLLVYQHFPRETRDGFISRLADEMRRRTGADTVFYLRTPQVVYFLVAQTKHEKKLRHCIERIAHTWNNGQFAVGAIA